MTASQLIKQQPNLSIGIIDPADTHYYQPAWTLVGANAYKFKDTARPMKSLIPKGVTWYQEYASKFNPDENQVLTKNGKTYTYDYLVVCPGLQIDPSMVDGLKESLGKGVICSNYTDPDHTWEVLKNFKGGTALFTQPTTPIKCGGAPQKIMYLADDAFRKTGVKDKTNIAFATAGTVIFGVKPIAKTLMKVVDRKDIQLNFGYKLVAVDANKQIAWYEMADGNRKGIKFDMMHLAPPQRSPDFIKNSPFALDTGWMKVDKHTMQSPDYSNVFGLGDICGIPTAKTGAAIRKQTPIVVANIQNMMKTNEISKKSYNGYSSCPLVTGYGKMVLAEFDYDKNFIPDPKLKQMLVFDSSVEHWRLWMLKKYLLPNLYWNKMLKGVDV
ncbi:UNVERIFIED_CONTAM: hypothetical protein GTU68_048365 [Idotea baltica]|nr:hypothetical protein [Idotea baltica]